MLTPGLPRTIASKVIMSVTQLAVTSGTVVQVVDLTDARLAAVGGQEKRPPAQAR